MVRGEFRIQTDSGEVMLVPNQFTTFGWQMLLKSAFWNQRPASLWCGLCAHNPADNIALASVQEPTIGVNSYQRQAIPMDDVNWPTLGLVNGETFIETREISFALSGALDTPVNRMFITDGAQVIAISSAFESGLAFYSGLIKQTYRLYFR